jgi:phosphoribosylformimino-5-aminoimidazole carboxamide ribotide isomerase
MIVYPAIDLKDGVCVRLLRGDMAHATVFNKDPADQAKAFADAGFQWLHVVDLNGAVEGRPVNGAAVSAILGAVDLPLQLGGGIRDIDTVAHWLDAGVRRVVLGTVALSNPELVKESCRRYPGRVAVGIDARGGRVAVSGWLETSDVTAVELARCFADAGVAAIVYTEIARDGMGTGPDLAATAALAAQVAIPVIASGGVGSEDDVRRAAATPGLAGLIVGKALYEGRVALARALEIARAC